MSTGITEADVRRIAHEVALEMVLAMSRVQAAHACGEVIDRYRVSASEVEGFLDRSQAPLVTSEPSIA